MKTIHDLEKRLRKLDYSQARLYLFCNFISLMLITAYSVMMLSPTVQTVFPEGGDSRKQMMAIFVLAVVGCTAFTVYATALFFRKKSRQIGILMALGVSKRKLAPILYREVLVLSFLSSTCGILAGIPFVALLWNGFRLIVFAGSAGNEDGVKGILQRLAGNGDGGIFRRLAAGELAAGSDQMRLSIQAKSLVIPLVFLAAVIGLACITARRYLARTDILDTIQEEHKNEPVKELGRWCGGAGIVILLVGAIGGYSAPAIYMEIAHAYPVWWLNLLYIPVFIGLYMILLHTVVHGWSFRIKKPERSKIFGKFQKQKNSDIMKTLQNPCGIRGKSKKQRESDIITPKQNPRRISGRFRKQNNSSLKSNLISYSMMKFQGTQTVNNMLVSTVLIAGACFAIFYLPMFTFSMTGDYKDRPYGYLYHYRADRSGLKKAEAEELASEYGLSLKDWHETEYISLGMDGISDVGDGDKIDYQYLELMCEGKFFSESGFRELTGVDVHVERGTYLGVTNEEETGTYVLSTGSTLLTNMDTGKTISVNGCELVHYNMLADEKGYYVLNDADYAEIAECISDEWRGKMQAFNVDGKDDYGFADGFFRLHVKSFGGNCNVSCFYDRVRKIAENEQGKVYWGDVYGEGNLSFEDERLNDSDFRLYWEYMPKILILEKTDFLQTFAVFLMMFLFIFLICITAACVICYTRCQTIALNNRYVFDDLRKLGAPPTFLEKEIRKQCCIVIRTPSVIGITAMSGLYAMIMFANDGKFTVSEAVGLLGYGVVILGIAALLYTIYYKTVKTLVKELV